MWNEAWCGKLKEKMFSDFALFSLRWGAGGKGVRRERRG
jgi:hypothetical protein